MPVPTWPEVIRENIAPELMAREFPFALDNSDIVGILEGTPYVLVPALAGRVLSMSSLLYISGIVEDYIVDGNPIEFLFLDVNLGAQNLYSPTITADNSELNTSFPTLNGAPADFINQPITLSYNSPGVVTGGDAGNTITGSISVAVLTPP